MAEGESGRKDGISRPYRGIGSASSQDIAPVPDLSDTVLLRPVYHVSVQVFLGSTDLNP